jgi:hypothetical protein
MALNILGSFFFEIFLSYPPPRTVVIVTIPVSDLVVTSQFFTVGLHFCKYGNMTPFKIDSYKYVVATRLQKAPMKSQNRHFRRNPDSRGHFRSPAPKNISAEISKYPIQVNHDYFTGLCTRWRPCRRGLRSVPVERRLGQARFVS